MPARCDAFVLHDIGTDFVKRASGLPNAKVMRIRGEEINLFVLLVALFSKPFWQGYLVESYIVAYASLARARLLLTFVDNSKVFYRLSKFLPSTQTAFLQNGIRSETLDIFGFLERDPSFHVDYMFVFGEGIGKHYAKFVSGQTIPIGSIKNNMLSTKSSPRQLSPPTIAFASQWSPERAFYNVGNYGGKTHEEFFLADKIVAKFLGKWCSEHGYKLIICGRSVDDSQDEHAFYQDSIPYDFIFNKNEYRGKTYEITSVAEITVFIDSTLGYEMLGRLKKVAALSIRGALLGWEDRTFGWPSVKKQEGSFWTSKNDVHEFNRIMNYLNAVTQSEWEAEVHDIAAEVMTFDEGNKILKERVRELLL